MPSHAQRSYFALRALNVELASIKDSKERRTNSLDPSNATIALTLRMTWWRQVLQELHNIDHSSTSTSSLWHHPVVRALHRAIQEKNLTRRFLERLVDAREADLQIVQMASLEDLVSYCEDSSSSLLYLSLECLGVRDDAADQVAGMLGVAGGLTTAIRSTIVRANRAELSIPADLLGTTKLRSDYFLARLDDTFDPKPEFEHVIQEAIQHMAYLASQQLSQVRERQADIPKHGKAILLHSVPTTVYLGKLKEANYNLWHSTLTSSDRQLVMLTMMGRVWWTGII